MAMSAFNNISCKVLISKFCMERKLVLWFSFRNLAPSEAVHRSFWVARCQPLDVIHIIIICCIRSIHINGNHSAASFPFIDHSQYAQISHPDPFPSCIYLACSPTGISWVMATMTASVFALVSWVFPIVKDGTIVPGISFTREQICKITVFLFSHLV